MEQLRKRESHFELLRIISMLMIIGSHLAQHSGIGRWQIMYEPFSFNTIWAYLLGTYGQLGVCLFIILSSWFLCDSEGIHIKKIILIDLECIFYTAIFYFILKYFKIENLGTKQFITIFLTPWLDGYWFIRTYFCFYLCIPALQFYSKKVSPKSQRKILLILTILIPVMQFILEKNEFENIGAFIYLYLLCSYLKRNERNFIERHCIVLFVLIFIFIQMSIISINIAGHNFARGFKRITQIYANRNIVVMLEAVSLFYIFKNYIKIGLVKPINEIAKTTLGIYILHDSWLFILYTSEKSLYSGGLLFEHFLKCGKYFYNSKYFGLYFLAAIFGIFSVCGIIEYIRIWLIDKKLFGKFTKFTRKSIFGKLLLSLNEL